MPKISAICVSHSSRFGLLQRAILNFCAQDYTDRELLIMVNEAGYADSIRGFLSDPRTLHCAGRSVAPLITVASHPFKATLEAFLFGMAWASGEWIACWDDDDQSHPTRLTYQLNRTRPYSASAFSSSLYYFYDSKELFITDYAQPTGKPSDRCAAGSLFFHRSFMPKVEIHSQGSWAAHVLDRSGHMRYDFIADEPWMFMVGTNDNNSRTEAWHRKTGSALPKTWERRDILDRSIAIEEWLQCYSWDDSVVDVCGKDAQAIMIDKLPCWPEWLASPLPPADWKACLPNHEIQQRLREERKSGT